MDGRPNWRNKAAFSNFSYIVWAGPKTMSPDLDTSLRSESGIFVSDHTSLSRRDVFKCTTRDDDVFKAVRQVYTGLSFLLLVLRMS